MSIMSAPTSPSWSNGVLSAASEGDVEQLVSLLDGGCPADTTGGIVCSLRGASELQGRTPLHYAAKNGHAHCCRVLLLHGADPNCTDKDGYTPIHYVCQFFNPIVKGQQKADEVVQCLRHLIDYGGNFRMTTHTNYSPIELARRHKNSVCQVELVQQGLKVESLMVLCRRVVCSLIRTHCLGPLDSLWIPASLHQFLQFDDIQASWLHLS